MATSETVALHEKGGWCFVEEQIYTVINEPLGDKSSEVSNDDCMLATVTDDQESKVHTGFGWRRESEMVEGVQEEVQEKSEKDRRSGGARFELRAQRQRGEDHDHQNLRRKIDQVQGEEWAPQSMNFRPAGVNKALASVNKFCQRRNRAMFDD